MRISDWSSDVCSSDLQRDRYFDQVSQKGVERTYPLVLDAGARRNGVWHGGTLRGHHALPLRQRTDRPFENGPRLVSEFSLPFGIETGFLELGANGRDIRRIERHAFAVALLLPPFIHRITPLPP